MDDFLSSIWKGIVEYWILICIVFTTTGTALLRTAKKNGKADYLEAGMCTAFALSIYFILDWLGIPSEAGIGIGTYISYIGTHRFSRMISEKFDLDDKEPKDKE